MIIMTQMDGKAIYFAFISYKREDYKWAKWLQRNLQSYRLPNKLHKRNAKLPSRLSPIFLDKSNLKPGYLDQGLRDEVRSSKFLIIVCSRAAHDSPKYLNDEIQYFLDAGNAPDHIIPFIVDKSPQPEQDCFPTRLQELCNEQTILGANIHDSGARQAFLKVVAAMHGLRLTEVESSDDRRRRRNRLLTALAAVLMVGAAVFSFDYFVPKTKYYVDYTTEFGVPVGIEQLNRQEAGQMSAHYTIISSRYRVRELRYENSAGQLLTHSDSERLDRPSCARYDYREDGGLEKVTWYNAEDEAVIMLRYDESLRTIDLEYPTEVTTYRSSAPLASRFATSMSDGLTSSMSSGRGNHSNIIRYLVDYDEDGRELERRYASDTANQVASDAEDIFGLRYSYNALGQVECVRYLGYAGTDGSAASRGDFELTGTRLGIYGKRYTYENALLASVEYFDRDEAPALNEEGWKVRRYIYDENRNLKEVRFEDERGELLPNGSHYAMYRCEYDARGFETGRSYFNAAGEDCLRSSGYSSFVRSCDEKGRETRIVYYGKDKEPVLWNGQYAGYTVEYGDFGPVKTSYFGLEGEPIYRIGSYTSEVLEYDDRGNVTLESYLGPDGEAVLFAGYSSVRNVYTYLEDGYEVRSSYLGVDGEVLPKSDGCYEFCSTYDAFGRLKKQAYYGANGEPVLYLQYYHSAEYGYNRLGNLVKTAYFDTVGNPAVFGLYGGYTQIVNTYNAEGTLKLGEAYLDADGKPALHTNGYASYASVYDAQGNEIERHYYGLDGEPVPYSLGGYASVLRTYDECGNLLCEEYLGVHGTPVSGSRGYTRVDYDYDSRGNVIKTSYFDENGEPVLCYLDYAEERCRYDERGKCIWEAYFDTNGEPVLCNDGYAAVHYAYDEHGNVIREAYYGVDDQPVMRDYGIADGAYSVAEYAYDQWDNKTETAYYDVNGKLVVWDSYDGICAKMATAYDEHQKEISVSYYGADGELMINEDKGYAILRTEYDDLRRKVRETYYDTNGEPMIAKNGCAGIAYEYEGQESSSHRLYYFGVHGEPALYQDDYAGVEYERDDFDNLVRISYIGLDGEYGLHGYYGYCHVMMEYNEWGNKTREYYLGVDGEPVLRGGDYASVEYAYKNGKTVRYSYFGLNGEPVEYGSYAVMAYQYDAYGRETEVAYFGADGQPTLYYDKYARRSREYDAYGRQVREAYFGVDGAPMLCDKNYASYVCEYDSFGQLVGESYYGTDGEPTADSDGYAAYKYTYDARGSRIMVESLDAGGRVIKRRDMSEGHEWWALEEDFDTDGNLIHRMEYAEDFKRLKEEFFNPDGTPAQDEYGRSVIEHSYNERGERTGESYFDGYGNPVLSRDYGHASERYAYDEKGRLIETTYYGMDGEPTLFMGYYFRRVYEYDEKDNMLAEYYFAPDGSPAQFIDRYASVRYAYNEKGYRDYSGTRYYDAEGNEVSQF